jgi:hypothetical protein
LRDDLDFTSSEASKVITRPKLTIRYVSPVSPPVSPLRTASLRNVQNPYDVNADTQVSPFDALIVINALHRDAAEAEENAAAPAFFLDVSGDGIVSPLDALLIINHLNGLSPVIGEGEGSSHKLLVAAGTLDAQRPLIGLLTPQHQSRREVDATTSGWSPKAHTSDDGSRSHPRPHDTVHYDWVHTAKQESMLDAIGDELLAHSFVNELASDDSRTSIFAELAND